MSVETRVRIGRQARGALAGAGKGLRNIVKERPGRSRRHAYRYWFVLPSILLIIAFFGIPFIANIFFAFLKWTNFSKTIKWSGLSNLSQMIHLGILTHALVVTILYALTAGLVQNVVGLSLAKALRAGDKVDEFFRSVYFVPVLFSPLAAGYIWKAIFQPDGPLNAAISAVIPGGFQLSWLGNAATALVCVAFVEGWKWSGLVTMVYIAGLNRIPAQLSEAAKMDGAGAWRRFWRIEVPLLAPAFTYNLVITIVGAFSAIDVAFAMTGGGPGNATSVLNVEMYAQYAQGMFGQASALGLTISILAVVTAVPMIAFMRSREVEM